jgi:hypothetical protein
MGCSAIQISTGELWAFSKMRRKLQHSLSSTTSKLSLMFSSIFLINFILCSHVFGTPSDESDSAGSQTATADDIEDEYETVRKQRSEKRARIASQRSASLEV